MAGGYQKRNRGISILMKTPAKECVLDSETIRALEGVPEGCMKDHRATYIDPGACTGVALPGSAVIVMDVAVQIRAIYAIA